MFHYKGNGIYSTMIPFDRPPEDTRPGKLENISKKEDCKGEYKMYTDKWIEFTINDLTWNEQTLYTQEYFEEYVNDNFVGMELDDEGKPKYIWSEKFVFVINTFNKIAIGNPAIVGVPRNPDWKEGEK